VLASVSGDAVLDATGRMVATNDCGGHRDCPTVVRGTATASSSHDARARAAHASRPRSAPWTIICPSRYWILVGRRKRPPLVRGPGAALSRPRAAGTDAPGRDGGSASRRRSGTSTRSLTSTRYRPRRIGGRRRPRAEPADGRPQQRRAARRI
jgi:hypothetical protein